ncbi:HAD-IIIC family phosphatase [Methylomonas sp. AM2-LC]|uniref:HAD-IIIC family phosphatase n=1 Tax=Methylomonas sp. AM2-LC TaxID=3153301 RepID=UPI00326633C3
MIRTKTSQESTPTPIVIVSSFTAEPVESILSAWMSTLHLYGGIEFAPYNQIFQQLLDPLSLMHKNQGGINILLLRFEDWLRAEKQADANKLLSLYNELCSAIHSAVLALKSPLIVCICPNSPDTNQLSTHSDLFNSLQNNIEEEFKSLSNCYFISTADWENYPLAGYYDATRDELGHIPYTPVGYAALGTVLSRKIYSIKSAPYKVIVLDCDNTLWGGVIGEEGLQGIDVSADWQFLQTFMLAQKQAGMLLCLCSKNIEEDVLEVLDQHKDMRIRREDIVSWRVNWQPKSENIRSLALELNLGLDAFIFVDDNPMECEEVRVNCPEVLSLNLPKQHIPDFLKHIWVFDRIKATSEDKMRTSLYQQDVARKNLEKTFSNYQDFLDGLELEVNIAEPGQEQIARVAQLTQRTNQFNNTTIRRSEIDIQRLGEAHLQVRMVEVKDRYGDYGLVGVLIFGIESQALCIQSFMLSCRVLGRGVENHILKYMASIAFQHNLPVLRIPYIPTPKNIPILHFLENIATQKVEQNDGSLVFDISTDSAAQMNAIVRTDASVETSKPVTDASVTGQITNSKTVIDLSLAQTTTHLQSAEKILAWVEKLTAKRCRNNTEDLVLPKTEVEKRLVAIWQSILNINSISTQDDYFELGGSSLLAVQLIVEVEQAFSVTLPLTSVLEYPTIQGLATRIQLDVGQNVIKQPILLNKSTASRIIYFIHDGDGEVLLYRNLALHLEADFQVYGIKPRGQANYPMLDTCMEDMAAYYIRQIYEIQAQGPYLLGGMCAGGVIAYEVARQLRADGHKVDFVGLIDAADVLATKRQGRIANARLTRISSVLDNEQNNHLVLRLITICKVISKKIVNLIRYEISSRLNKWQASLKVYLLGEYQRRQWSLPKFLSDIEVRYVYLYAETNYKPETGIDNELVLFRATEGHDADTPYVTIYVDPLFGWGERTTEGVKVYDIPGGHSSMLQEPNVKQMADCIREYVKI